MKKEILMKKKKNVMPNEETNQQVKTKKYNTIKDFKDNVFLFSAIKCFLI